MNLYSDTRLETYYVAICDMPDCGWTDEETDFLMLFAKEG